MKGYALVALIASIILLSFPPLILQGSDNSLSQDEPITSITVQHTDSDTVSEMSLFELTVYETAAQIAADAPLEAIKAQAACCYTLLRYQQLSSECVTTTCLSYPDEYNESFWKARLSDQYDESMAIYREAVNAVFAKPITYQDQPIMALSHVMNSGMTEDGAVILGQELPYLKSVASPADAVSSEQLKTVALSVATVKEQLTALLGTAPENNTAVWFQDPQKTEAGTVKTIKVGSHEISGTQLQEALGLSSAAFDVAVQGDQVIVTVRGKGHFVGFSTVGAIAMANDGHTYDEILKHYYTGVNI